MVEPAARSRARTILPGGGFAPTGTAGGVPALSVMGKG
jgi:hypothetical protein